MDEKRKKHGWATSALFAAILMVLYVASSGPATLALKLAGSPPVGQTLFAVFYWPLACLPRAALDILDWWLERWLELSP